VRSAIAIDVDGLRGFFPQSGELSNPLSGVTVRTLPTGAFVAVRGGPECAMTRGAGGSAVRGDEAYLNRSSAVRTVHCFRRGAETPLTSGERERAEVRACTDLHPIAGASGSHGVSGGEPGSGLGLRPAREG